MQDVGSWDEEMGASTVQTQVRRLVTIERLRRAAQKHADSIRELKAKKAVNNDVVNELRYGKMDSSDMLWVCGGNFYTSMRADRAQALLTRNNQQVTSSLAVEEKRFKQVEEELRMLGSVVDSRSTA
jgi:hypothetical protein